MLDLRYVVDHLDEVRAGLSRRGAGATVALDELAPLSIERRDVIVKLETLRAKKNEVSAAMAKVDKKSDEFAKTRDEMRLVGEQTKELEAKQKAVDAKIEELLLYIPNVPDATAPDGGGSDENQIVRTWGEAPKFAFAPRDHADLGVANNTLDFERGTKISGARFTVLRGMGARLERALMQFMLDVHSNEHGYVEIWPPVLIKDTTMRGTGQLPKFAKDAFRIAEWDENGEAQAYQLYLAPTAEVPVTNLHADEILDGASLPIAYTAYTACFRSEAGSYGKDTKGLIRQHQFDKVELVRFVKPETAQVEHEKLTSHAEAILQKLGLHYRVALLCTGDMGAVSKKTYDLEVWLPAQNTFREISSCSWFGDYQARRAKIRYRAEAGSKPELVHTINGSGLAIGRTLVAIYENFQEADGSIRVPKVLVPYMGGVEKIPAHGA
ncbi:MAG: serine--tRNA ligase [Sandaracinaceae bacterium]|nr:serine--tRNA ligase [Sandaracinaceae bacterium]